MHRPPQKGSQKAAFFYFGYNMHKNYISHIKTALHDQTESDYYAVCTAVKAPLSSIHSEEGWLNSFSNLENWHPP